MNAGILLPKAVAWSEEQERDILASGRSLSNAEVEIARAVGVRHPEKIRIKTVTVIPLPQDPMLRQAALQAGLLGPTMAGLTLFYGMFFREGTFNRTLLAHECRHVYQYEQRGSITGFLQEYIPQTLAAGYSDSPLEKDAREAAERYELVLRS